MARVAFILLCHRNPAGVLRQAAQLTAAGDYVAVHFDASASAADFRQIVAGLADNPNVVVVKRRVKCGWGEWSLVEATLRSVAAALVAFERATHFYMVSGDCMPIKSAQYVQGFLDDDDKDYIESFDFFDSFWIKTGFREERLIYRHYFNERTQKRRFYASFALQKRLKLTRVIPPDIQMMIGSQWWCLRRRTVEAVMDFIKARPDVIRFFRTTWIPDETFFQTLVRHLVPGREIETRTLTFLMFTDYGMPATFYNDHLEMLLAQDALFARKISPEAVMLKENLGAIYASDRMDFPMASDGRNLFAFMTTRGREGRRFAPRRWESEATVGRGRELLIISCKKWHVAKRLVAAIRDQTDIPAFGYVFNEAEPTLPDLGGIEKTVDKRGRHRRAFMGLLFDQLQTDRLLICLDTSSLDLITDFFNDRATVRLLELDCHFTDEYLAGHAVRVGLAGPQTPASTIARLLPTVRHDIIHERSAIRDLGVQTASRICEEAPVSANAAALGRFLHVDDKTAMLLAQTPNLFVD